MKQRSQSEDRFPRGSMARYTVDDSAVVFAAEGLLWQPYRGSRQGRPTTKTIRWNTCLLLGSITRVKTWWWQTRVVLSLISPSGCSPRNTGENVSCYERSKRHI
ncbi:uncharacterized protein LAESUDRAFT_731489 [Laetiporus sulphureus 93-53]|uniref:Uncharacterized protein n=1 Tax=Laetiporus sulphureus 93-53 TaxID=1314785 RepID=A0A165BL42_9APHY|nr:uncharacterized protein LAESUDRAFT_731489 [Laetiporus sulphureus 93-53]KZT01253.1 hypothetical protein LAESUDRAFT_731489 [Laetiporus sulphureus 93-53]